MLPQKISSPPQVGAPKAIGQIDQWNCNLISEREILAKAAANLILKIAPVLRDVSPGVGDDKAANRPVLVPLAESLRSHCDAITAITAMLEDAANRVEL